MQPVERPPNLNLVILAAQHIGQPLSAHYSDHHILVEADLAVVEAFDLDIVQPISDPLDDLLFAAVPL